MMLVVSEAREWQRGPLHQQQQWLLQIRDD